MSIVLERFVTRTFHWTIESLTKELQDHGYAGIATTKAIAILGGTNTNFIGALCQNTEFTFPFEYRYFGGGNCPVANGRFSRALSVVSAVVAVREVKE